MLIAKENREGGEGGRGTHFMRRTAGRPPRLASWPRKGERLLMTEEQHTCKKGEVERKEVTSSTK